MAKQIIVLAFIIFLAAVGMAAAQEPNVPASAAAQLGPAAAAAGVNLSNPNDVMGALRGAANGAPLPGNPANQQEEKENSAAAPAVGGAVVAGGVVGSFFFF